MAFTVTATMTGSPTAPTGGTIRVTALLGAKPRAQQNGGTGGGSSASSQSFDASVTVAATGSVVYGAASNFTSATAFTADARTTFNDNVSAPTGDQTGTFRSTAATSATGATLFGATNSASGSVAAAEILAASTISEDSSTSSTVASPTSGSALTSPSFTPPAGCLLVVRVAAVASAGPTGFTISDTSGLGLVWTQLASFGGGGGQNAAAVFIADVPAAIGGSPNDLKQLLADPRFRARMLKQRITAPALQDQLLAFNGLGGTNGATPTATDTGVGNAWDTINTGTAGTVVYDNTHGSPQGCQSIKFGVPSTSDSAFTRWTPTLVDTDQVWWSCYMYFTANPATTFGFILGRRNADASNCGQWRINASGQIVMSDATVTAVGTTVNSIPLNQPFRVEGRMTQSQGPGGFMEVRLYADDNPASSPIEVLTVGAVQTAQQIGNQQVSSMRFGFTAATTANTSFNMWGMQASNVGYPAPLLGAGGPTSATITLADTGVGLDILGVSASITLADTGAGADAITVAAGIVLADTGAGSDSLVDAASLSLSESGVGVDTLVDSAAITLSQPGTGSDTIVTGASAGLTDPGFGSDSLVVGVSLQLSDAATGADTVGDSASVSLPDSGLGADTILDAILATLADSGVGADSLSVSVGGITKTLTDSGTGVDSLVVSVIAALNDLGEGIDGVVQCFRLADFGQGSDTAIVAVAMSLADSGQGSDILAVYQNATINLSDAGVGTDTIVVATDNSFTITLSDSGQGTDTLAVSPTISLADSGTGVDALQITVQMWLGYDDPCTEMHTEFDPHLVIEPAIVTGRESVLILPYTWEMDAAAFVAHMARMHGGKAPGLHRHEHENDLGGEPGHRHR